MAEAKELGITDPPFNGINYTNRVLVEKTEKRVVLYCPTYMHFKIKNLVGVNIADLEAEINTTLIHIINFKGIPKYIR